MAKNHISRDFEKSELHHLAGSYEGGKCISAHVADYKEDNSCSYRWQAVHRVETIDTAIYKRHRGWPHTSESSQTGYVSRRRSDKTKLSGAKAKLQEKISAMLSSGALSATVGSIQQWKKKGKIKGWRQLARAKRFRTAFSPYANTPHHIVPWQQLANAIDKTCEQAKGRKAILVDVVLRGLADEAYNTNHFHNLVILPHEYPDACQLLLPTHYQGFNHPVYSGIVEGRLGNALDPYLNLAQQEAERKVHAEPLPHPLDLKDKLVGLSGQLRKTIVEDGKAAMQTLCAQYATHEKSKQDPESKRAKVNLDKLMSLVP